MNMPDEIFALIIIAMSGGIFLAVMAQIIAFNKWKIERETEGKAKDDSSLTTSELETMIREAVEKATQPLSDRMEQLEEHVAQHPKQLAEQTTTPLLDLDLEDGQEEAVEVIRKRVR